MKMREPNGCFKYNKLILITLGVWKKNKKRRKNP